MKKVIIISSLIILTYCVLSTIKPKQNLEPKNTTEQQIETENMMAIYLKGNDNTYHQINAMPIGDYTLNETKTYCTEPDNPDNKLNDRVSYNSGTKTLSISTLNKKNTKCYLYFDKMPTSGEVLAKLEKELSQNDCPTEVSGVTSIAGPETSQKLICKATDDFGDSYYFRGTTDDNWVKFGKIAGTNEDIWWRIIRINGNGTIRLIYAGLTDAGATQAPSTTGTGTQITTTYTSNTTIKQYNKTQNDNKYVGFMYGGKKDSGTSTTYSNAHENTNDSTIKEELETWWDTTNLESLKNKIDVETGFCNDRQINTGNETWWSNDKKTGYGTGSSNSTAYAPFGRLYTNSSFKTEQTPTLKCGENYYNHTIDTEVQQRDLFTGPKAEGTTTSDGKKITGNNALTNPVGLITMDEVVFAGGFGGKNNSSYWLYTNSNYWTMSPYRFSGSYALMFYVISDGYLSNTGVGGALGVRPVINLKANTTFTTKNPDNKGTSTNPYIVQ